MKKIRIIRQLWKIIASIIAFTTGHSLFIVCRSKKVVQKWVDGKPVLLIELEEENIALFGMTDGRVDSDNMLSGINHIRRRK